MEGSENWHMDNAGAEAPATAAGGAAEDGPGEAAEAAARTAAVSPKQATGVL